MSKVISFFPGVTSLRSKHIRLPAKLLLRICFAACLIFIVCVSVYDSMLVVQFQETILHDERNPICSMLIRKDPDNLSWFLLGKTSGNVFVITTIFALAQFKYRHVMLVACGVAMFQLSLLVYLNYADKKTGFLHFDGLYSNDPEMYRNGVKSLLIHLTAALTIAISAVTSWTIRLKYRTSRKKQLSAACVS